MPVWRELYICLLPGGNRCVDPREEGRPEPRAAVWSAGQHRKEGAQRHKAAAAPYGHVYVPLWGKILCVLWFSSDLLGHLHLLLCLQECFDSKPRIISKRSKENLAVCSNLTARHPFDDNKWVISIFFIFATFRIQLINLCLSPAGAWCTWWGQPTCATVRCVPCTRSASLMCVATRSATGARERTAVPSLTPS